MNKDKNQKHGCVFIIHAAFETLLVDALARSLERIFPSLDFFVSSLHDSLNPGDVWWDKIRENSADLEMQKNLECPKMVLVCISRQSINKPGILFESGIGLGCGAKLLPVIIDDLPVSALELPLSMFQAFTLKTDGFQRLVDRIANTTGVLVERDLVNLEASSLAKDVSISSEISMGFYVGFNKKDITSGWLRYDGDPQTIEIHDGYVSIGYSYIDGFRYPHDDSLSAPWQYWGFRIRCVNDVNIYAVLRLFDGSSKKIYVSSMHNSWGFTSEPIDEFRVPLRHIPKNEWIVIIIDISSLESEFEYPAKTIIGIRVRGPLQLSHMWCVKEVTQIPDKYSSIAIHISYPG